MLSAAVAELSGCLVNGDLKHKLSLRSPTNIYLFYCVFAPRVQALGISRNYPTLDVHVLLAHFTEERIPWRTHITHSQDNAGRSDRLRLCVRIH